MIRFDILIVSAALALAGAADAKPLFKQGTALAPPTDLAPSCSAESARRLIGQPGEGKGEEARIAADADSVRIIRPGDMVTHDLRDSRLNVKLDEKGMIAALSCG